MHISAAQVQVIFAATPNQQGRNQIHNHGHYTYTDQHVRFNFRRGDQAAKGIIKDSQGDQRQDGCVDQGHQDAGTVVAIGFPSIGRFCGMESAV